MSGYNYFGDKPKPEPPHGGADRITRTTVDKVSASSLIEDMNSQINLKITKALVIVEGQNTLGEGPLWHPTHQMLYWVDIQQKLVHGFAPHTGRHREWPVPKKVGTVALTSSGNLLLGLQGEIAELNLETGIVTTMLELESNLPDNRCNDGKCDPSGRFWVGTMNLNTKHNTGSLYCVDKDLKVHQVLRGLSIANGMAWSPDERYMYFIDSADRAVRRFSLDPGKVSLEGEEVVLRFDARGGLPDGMCVDREGMLWIGFWGGNRVGRYDCTTGKHLADVHVPAPHVTSCCFGGTDLKTLYITTAREGLTPEQLLEFPLSGSLFACKTDVPGMAGFRF